MVAQRKNVMPVEKTYSKVLLMIAAVITALLLGFVLTPIFCLVFWFLAKPQGYLNAEIIWSNVSAFFAPIATYLIVYIFVRKCGCEKIKLLNILCFVLTILWCVLWADMIVFVAELN